VKRARPNKRFRFGINERGEFDELCLAGGLVHLEMMTKTECWVKVGNKVCFIDLRTGIATPFEDYT
jgi:hypothetical protein